MAEKTDDEQRPPHLFKPGQSGNPNGRPKGSRNKLGEQFLADLQADWSEHGIAALVAMREEKPNEYVKVVAGILPKELLITKSPLEEMSDDDIADALDALGRIASQFRDDRNHPKPTHGGTGTA